MTDEDLKDFFIKTVVEDYRNNGKIRKLIISEQFESAAIFGPVAGSVCASGNVQAGDAFPTDKP